MKPAVEPIVSVRGASVVYNGVTALRDATIDIAPGEFLTLLGPSGSGKTTLLNAIAGVVPLTTGRIFISGVDVTAVPPNLRGLGMVFQNYALMPHLSVFDNIAFPLRIRGVDKDTIRSKVLNALELVRLGSFAERRPRQLSGGQQQRVALARSIVYEPKVILMDEPLGALDKQLREEMQNEIRHLHTMLGTTMIYVTHDQEEALSMSTTIALVSGGLIQDVGAPHDIYFRPRTSFTAGFVGSSNLLKGVYRGQEDGAAIVVLESGAVVRSLAPGDARPGQQVQVMVRPEALDIEAAGQPRPGENELKGDVVDQSLQGATWRTLVQIDPQTKVLVQSLSRLAPPLALGNRVRLLWRPEDTVVLTR
ncbi:ABC transporter ATP-binding protein [Bosea sp. (in: a-proteobacteria)]|uniref:ABC transporter ATP-binding protein n=1 Tax=Bosea sp. (in: a-proteobacteria) TaxID=1871050 RepID=UPI002FC6CAE8